MQINFFQPFIQLGTVDTVLDFSQFAAQATWVQSLV